MHRIVTLLTVCLLCSLPMVIFGCGENEHNEHGPTDTNGTTDIVGVIDLEDGSGTSFLSNIKIGPTANRIRVRAGKAYIVNSGSFPQSTNASVQVIDLERATLITTIPFPDGTNPIDISLISDTKAYVTCLYGNNVTVIDPTAEGPAAIIKAIDLPTFDHGDTRVPAGPMGIVHSGRYAYTANCGFDLDTFSYLPGTVSVIDTETDTLVDIDNDSSNGNDTPIATSQVNPQDLDVDAQGRVWVLCTGNYGDQFGFIDVIDPTASWSVTRSIPVGGSPVTIAVGGGMALMGAGDSSNANLYAVDTTTFQVLHDSSTPLRLLPAEQEGGFWMIGKIAIHPTEPLGYVPVGYTTGTISALVEVFLGHERIEVQRRFVLPGSGQIPSSVALWNNEALVSLSSL